MTFTRETHLAFKNKSGVKKKDKGPGEEDVARYHANRNSADVLVFAKVGGDAPLNDPSRPVLGIAADTKSSARLRSLLKDRPEARRVEYDHTLIDTTTITRWIACLSPTLRVAGLPTHDITEIPVAGERTIKALPIAWSVDELMNLYRFAVYMGSPDVCDMIVLRLCENMHRPGCDVCSFPVEWVKELVRRGDNQAVDILSDVLIAKEEMGWKALVEAGLNKWDVQFKAVLVAKLEGLEEGLLDMEDGDEWEMERLTNDDICQRFHQHYEAYETCYRDAPPITSPPLPESNLSIQYWSRQADLHANYIPPNLYAIEMEAEIEVRKDYLAMRQSQKVATTEAEKAALAADIEAWEEAAGQRELKRRARDKEYAVWAEMMKMEDEELKELEDAMLTIEISPPQLPTPSLPADAPKATYIPPPLKSQCFPEMLGNGPDLDTEKQLEKMRLVGEAYQLFQQYYGEEKARRWVGECLADKETVEMIQVSMKIQPKEKKAGGKKGAKKVPKPQGKKKVDGKGEGRRRRR